MRPCFISTRKTRPAAIAISWRCASGSIGEHADFARHDDQVILGDVITAGTQAIGSRTAPIIGIGVAPYRNGLRPSRYYVTKDDLVIMASEVGVLPIEPERIAKKWRLQPGKIFLVDMKQGDIVDDREIKSELVDKRPWRRWIEENMIELDKLPVPKSVHQPDHDTLLVRQHAFGYTTEELKMIISPMAIGGLEGLGSMGTDTPLACLSGETAASLCLFQAAFRTGDQSAAGCEF